MADKQMDQNEAAAGQPKFSLKMVLVVVAVLVIEAVVISAAFMLNQTPSTAEASLAALDAEAMARQPVEVLVVTGKYQNTRRGVAYTYDTEVYIVVRQKHRAEIEQRIEQMRTQINTDIATIFRRAEPGHLLEPELSTITRQINAVLDRRFGIDEESGEPIVQKVLIPKCTQFRSDL